jgi:hypothetical protein
MNWRKLWLPLLALTVVANLLVGSVLAADAANPTGTWKWSVTFNDQTREMTLKLKFADGKLTGAMVGRENRETPIAEASFKDGKVSFTVTREREGRKMVSKYEGKLDGDTIKGKISFKVGDESRSRDWEAKRAK